MIQTYRTDQAGRLTLSADLLAAIGIGPDEVVILEFSNEAMIVRRQAGGTTITKRIAAMNLPVSDWKEMKREIEEGRLA